jgi:hypothetical protein
MRAASGLDVALQTFMMALIVDSIRQMGMGFGGKKLPKDQHIAAKFNGEERRAREEFARLATIEREFQRRLRLQQSSERSGG